jgi:uncharacterized protein with HEPN domain
VRGSRERIEDMVDAINRAVDYQPHLADSDPACRMAYDAILRNLAVVGEAAARLPESVTGMIDQPWASIRGLRNIVIHEYFAVDSRIVADIVSNYLAPLASALNDYLSVVDNETGDCA